MRYSKQLGDGRYDKENLVARREHWARLRTSTHDAKGTIETLRPAKREGEPLNDATWKACSDHDGRIAHSSAILAFEYAILLSIWSAEHCIVRWIGCRSYEETSVVRLLCVLETPFEVYVAIRIVSVPPALFWLCSVFIERLYGRSEDCCHKLLRYNIRLRFSIVREDGDPPGFSLFGLSWADFDVEALIVLVTGQKHV